MLPKESIDYEVLFEDWKRQHGVSKTSKKYGYEYYAVPNKPEDRQNMLHILVRTFVEMYGFEEKDFTNYVKNKIIDACVWAEYDKKKLIGWKSHVSRDLNFILGLVFEKKFVVTEMPKTVRPKEEAPVVRSDYKENPEELQVDKVIETERSPGELRNPLILSEIDSDIPAPEYEIDEEFLKLCRGEGNE